MKKLKIKSKKNKDIVVFGTGRFGSQIIEHLALVPQYRIIAVDTDQDKLRGLPRNVSELVVGDCSNEQFIEELGMTEDDIFIIAIGGNIQSSLLTAVILRKKYPTARILAKAVTDEHEAILKQLGIKEIINPEKAGAKRAVVKILNPLLEAGRSEKVGSMQELEGGMSIVRVHIPESYVNKKVKDLNLSRDMTIILVHRKGKPRTVYGDFKLEKGDEILLLAENKLLLQYIAENISH